jgi:transcriptional regulator with XRE-family HTH domain
LKSWKLGEELRGTEEENMTVGKRIRLARKFSGLSIRKLAKMIGMDPNRLSKYERDILVADEKLLLRLANALDIKTEFFDPD